MFKQTRKKFNEHDFGVGKLNVLNMNESFGFSNIDGNTSAQTPTVGAVFSDQPQMSNVPSRISAVFVRRCHLEIYLCQGRRSCAGARVAPAEKFRLGRKL